MMNLDLRQWRTLHSVMLKCMFRSSMSWGKSSSTNTSQKSKETRVVIGIVFTYLMSGILGAFILGQFASPLGELLVLSFLSVLAFSTLMAECPNSLFSQSDFEALGFFPISATTYLFSKLSGSLAFQALICTAAASPSLLMILITDGWIAGVGWILSIAIAIVFLCFAVISLYSFLAMVVSPSALHVVSTCVQVASVFFIMAIYIFFISQERDLGDLTVSWDYSENYWLLFAPPFWFLSLFLLIQGELSANVVAGALMAIVGSVLLATFLLSHVNTRFVARLSLSLYRESVGKRRKEPVSLTHRRVFSFNPERIAVGTLALAHLKFDATFRNSLFGLLPISVFWLVMPILNGTLTDPFAPAASTTSVFMVLAALALIAMSGIDTCRISEQHQASWLLFSLPVSLGKCAVGTFDWVICVFVVPILCLLFVAFIVLFDSTTHATMHLLTLGWLTYALASTKLFLDPSIPFTESRSTTRLFGSFFLNMFLVIVVCGIASFTLTKLIYQSYVSYAVSLLLGIGACILLRRLVLLRCEKSLQKAEFLA